MTTFRTARRPVRLVLLAAVAATAVVAGVTLADRGAGGSVAAGNRPRAAQTTSGPLTERASFLTGSTGDSRPAARLRRLPANARSLVRFVEGGTLVKTRAYREGAWHRHQRLRPTPGAVEFTTPSGNISCGMTGSRRSVGLVCEVAAHSWPRPPKPSSCDLNWAADAVGLTARQVTRGLCVGGPPFAPISRVLPYGSTVRLGQMACRSDAGFLACVDYSTHRGFAVNRRVVRAY